MCINPPHSIILDLVTVSFIGLGKKTIKLHEVIVIQTFHHIEDFIKYTIKAKEAPFNILFYNQGQNMIFIQKLGRKVASYLGFFLNILLYSILYCYLDYNFLVFTAKTVNIGASFIRRQKHILRLMSCFRFIFFRSWSLSFVISSVKLTINTIIAEPFFFFTVRFHNHNTMYMKIGLFS